MKTLEIAFVMPELTDARTRVRIDAVEQQGASVRLVGFRRFGFYTGRDHRHPVVHLGTIAQKKYFSRFFKYMRAIRTIRHVARKSDVIYTFGVDLALLAWLALSTRGGGPVLVLEIQDIRDVLLRQRISSRIFRFIDRFLATRIDLMVVTSPLYLSEYYRHIAGAVPRRAILVENKVFEHAGLSLDEAASNPPGESAEYLTIGYFGVIRCQSSLEFMLRVSAETRGKVRFYIRGIFLDISDAVIANIRASEYCSYGGEYVSPDELPNIYGRVDMVWACYPESRDAIGNWLWARTNRFYEACYFAKPIIALRGSADGAVVELQDIGTCLLPTATDEGTHLLLAITAEHVSRWRANMESLPRSMYLDGDQHKLLYDQMCKAISRD